MSSTAKTLATPQQPLAIGRGVVTDIETLFHTVLSIFEGAEGTLALKIVAKELITNAT